MNIILVTEKKNPRVIPIVFIAPDNVDADRLKESAPQKYADRFDFTVIDGDQPTPVGSVADIWDFFREVDA